MSQNRKIFKEILFSTFLKIHFFCSSKALRTIEITDEIPLTIFGALVPALDSEEFRLPWLTTQTDLRKEKLLKRTSSAYTKR